MNFDVVFLHPPSVFDFRKRVWFPGQIAKTVRFTPVFTMFPIGLVSIADQLDRLGYKVKIINLADKMLIDKKFDVEHYIKRIDSRIFGIDLHWCVHSQGAVEIARICKEHHPNSLVVLGGLTATCFNLELVDQYPFIDAVVRGEGEAPIVKLVQEWERYENLSNVPNLTYKRESGEVQINPEALPPKTLDQFEFTRLDLIESSEQLFEVKIGSEMKKVWEIPVCRGCLFNCITCGGSAYSYRKLMRRIKPAFRSVERIVDDFKRLDERKINSVFLFQDVRMAGSHYWKDLFKALHRENWSNIEHVTMELFYPANSAFISYLSQFRPAGQVTLTISPESGSENVRKVHGRYYSNESLLQTVKSCLRYKIPIFLFFMIGLAEDNWQTLEETWGLWDKLLRMSTFRRWVGVQFGPMLLLDPGSLAFDIPEAYGYRLRFRNFKDYYNAMLSPSWRDWMSYETRNLTVEDLTDAILRSSEEFIKLRHKYGFCTEAVTRSKLLKISLERIILEEIEDILRLSDLDEKQRRLRELEEISKDPLLSYSYVLTHEESERINLT